MFCGIALNGRNVGLRVGTEPVKRAEEDAQACMAFIEKCNDETEAVELGMSACLSVRQSDGRSALLKAAVCVTVL